jgi:hypothetical protein
MEIARRDGELVAGITAFADGPEEMREVIKHHVKIGVDNIKLSMSGEEVYSNKAEIRLSSVLGSLLRSIPLMMYSRSLKSDLLRTAISPMRKLPRA